MTFNQWIKSKGVDKIAASLKVTPATIYSWVHRGQIPRSVWPDLVLAFSEVGLNDLLDMEAASK